MNAVRSVPRVRGLTREEFFRDYVLAQKPVIIERVLEGQALGELDTPDKAARVLGEMRLEVEDKNAGSGYSRAQAQLDEKPTRSFRELLTHYRDEPRSTLRSSEQAAPPELQRLYTFPRFTYRRDGKPDGDAFTQVFLGPANITAHCHFDADFRENILVQVFGRKRVVIVEPPHGFKLLPLRQLSSVFLEHLNAEDQAQYLGFLHAYECELGPGDGLFMPALVWHHVDYHDLAFSLSLRFGRGPARRWLQQHLHRDIYTQNLAWLFPGDDVPHDKRGVLEALEERLAAPYESSFEKWKAISALSQSLCAEHARPPADARWAWTALDGVVEKLMALEVERGLYPLGPDGKPAPGTFEAFVA